MGRATVPDLMTVQVQTPVTDGAVAAIALPTGSKIRTPARMNMPRLLLMNKGCSSVLDAMWTADHPAAVALANPSPPPLLDLSRSRSGHTPGNVKDASGSHLADSSGSSVEQAGCPISNAPAPSHVSQFGGRCQLDFSRSKFCRTEPRPSDLSPASLLAALRSTDHDPSWERSQQPNEGSSSLFDDLVRTRQPRR